MTDAPVTADDSVLIATLRKNATEDVRIQLRKFKDTLVCAWTAGRVPCAFCQASATR